MNTILGMTPLHTPFDVSAGTLGVGARVERHLADLQGCFHDGRAFDRALLSGNPLIYTVAAVEPGIAAGDLHYGLGVIQPGLIGDEYFMTKGHLHTWREAAEVYVGLAGSGVMLLEDEASGEGRLVPLLPNSVVYVPGHTAHRTMNTGEVPLAYLGVYPARAGHDYDTIAQRNFRHIVVKRDGRPDLMERR